MLDILIENRLNTIRLHYKDYRSLLELCDCDVFLLLNKYGLEHIHGDEYNITLFIADYNLFAEFIKLDKFQMFPV